MFYISVDALGNITGCGSDPSIGPISVSNDSLFPLIRASMVSYKYVSGAVGNYPSPNVYSTWNGTDWATDPDKITEAQTYMTSKIMAYRDSVMASGFLYNANWYESDTMSLLQYSTLYFLGANIPSNLPAWGTLDGASITLTQAVVAGIFNAGITFVYGVYGEYRTQLTAMLASSDPYNYNYHTGWPATYLTPVG